MAAVDSFRQFGVPLTAKDRAGARVGVEKRDLLLGEAEVPPLVAQVVRSVEEEREFRLCAAARWPLHEEE